MSTKFTMKIKAQNKTWTFYSAYIDDLRTVKIDFCNGTTITVIELPSQEQQSQKYAVELNNRISDLSVTFCGRPPITTNGIVAPDLANAVLFVQEIVDQHDLVPIKSPDKTTKPDGIIELSTTHLSRKTIDLLTANAILNNGDFADETEYNDNLQDLIDIYPQSDSGYFVRLLQPHNDDGFNLFPDLKRCAEIAEDAHAGYILFDRDAEILPQLPAYVET